MTLICDSDESAVTLANGMSIGKMLIPPKTLTAWKKMLLEEHSSLEFADFRMVVNIDGRAVSHLVRHTKGHPRHIVQSQREDWTGKERPSPETKRLYLSKWTPYSWMAMARQRLCFKAASYTREVILEAIDEMKQIPVEADSGLFFQGIAWASVPECVYRAGCPYKRSCGWYEKNKNWFFDQNISERYDAYHELMEGK